MGRVLDAVLVLLLAGVGAKIGGFTPGRFIAAVDVPADGTYEAVIANVNEDTTKPTRFVITRMDWIVR